MAERPIVKIVTEKSGAVSHVYVDGVRITGVRAVAFGHPAGDLARVALLLIPSKVDIVAEAVLARHPYTPTVEGRVPVADVTALEDAFRAFVSAPESE